MNAMADLPEGKRLFCMAALEAGRAVTIAANGTIRIGAAGLSADERRERERVKKQRQRARTKGTCGDIGGQAGHEGTSGDIGDNENSPSPSLPPPLPSTPPLSPPHPPTPEKESAGTCARTRQVNDFAESTAENARASAVPLPLLLRSSPVFVEVWRQWCDYRTERASKPTKTDRIPWTERAATVTLAEVERFSASIPLEAIAGRFRDAIAGNWQGPNLSSMDAPRPASGRPTPTHQPPRQHASI